MEDWDRRSELLAQATRIRRAYRRTEDPDEVKRLRRRYNDIARELEALKTDTGGESSATPMGLILVPCTACGKQLSPLASSCPECGHPLRTATNSPVQQITTKEPMSGCSLFAVIVLAIVGAAILIFVLLFINFALTTGPL